MDKNVESRRIELLYLPEKDVEGAGLTVNEAIEIVEEVFRSYGEGTTIVPPKISLDLGVTGKYHGVATAMPAYVGPFNIAGTKWIGTNWSNAEKYNLPNYFSIIILTNPETFAPVALIGGTLVTSIRTGAATAVAAKYLARKNSEIVGIVGAGKQGTWQLLALNEVLKIEEVRIADVNKKAREKYAQEFHEKFDLNVKPVENVKEAVSEADVIVTVTNANEPLVKHEWIKKGCFICAVGSFQELEYRLVKAMNKIVVDHIKQTMYRGELAHLVRKGLISERDVYAELGDIVAGKKPGRESEEEKILCIPIGIGGHDVAVACRIYQLAMQKKIGQKLEWM